MAMVRMPSGAANELPTDMFSGLEVLEPRPAWKLVLVKSVLTTSMARSPGDACGPTLMTTMIKEVLSCEMLSITTSAAGWLACESDSAASGREITTLAFGRKFVPCNVSCKCWSPCTASDGPAEINVGRGAVSGGGGGGGGPGEVTVNGCALDVRPVVGLNTVTWATPALATSEAGIAAVNWVLLRNDVGRPLPFHCTCEAALKFVPVRLSVKAGLPAVAVLGTMELMVGAWAKRSDGVAMTSSNTSKQVLNVVLMISLVSNDHRKAFLHFWSIKG